jgi:hypothetical protein
MNTSTMAQEKSPDQALAAIAQAIEELAPAQGKPTRPADHLAQQQAASQTPVGPDPAMPHRSFASGRIVPRLVVVASVLVGAGAIDLWWSSLDNRAVQSKLLSLAGRVSGFLASEKSPIETAKVTAQASSTVGANKVGETAPPVQTKIVSQLQERTSAISPEMAQRIQTLEQRLAGLEEGIGQIAKLARENAELAGQLRETQEKMARRADELATGLKIAEEKMSRGDGNIAEQPKANQEQTASMGAQAKASQEQIAGAATSGQRAQGSAAPQPKNAATKPKPAPRPLASQARAHAR